MKIEPKSFGCGVAVGALVMFIVCGALLLAGALLMRKRAAFDRAKSDPPSAFCPVVGDEAVTRILTVC